MQWRREREREAVVMFSCVFFLWEVAQPHRSINTHMYEHTPAHVHTHTHTGRQHIFLRMSEGPYPHTVREARVMLTTIFHSCDPIMLCRQGKGRDGAGRK